MSTSKDSCTVETATKWLDQFHWGAALIAQIADGPDAQLMAHWLAMVARKRDEQETLAEPVDVDDDDDEIDIDIDFLAAWPALSAGPYC